MYTFCILYHSFIHPSPTTTKKRLNEIYSKHTGQSVEKIKDALERDKFMSADEAKSFGLIDKVVEKRSN